MFCLWRKENCVPRGCSVFVMKSEMIEICREEGVGACMIRWEGRARLCLNVVIV